MPLTDLASNDAGARSPAAPAGAHARRLDKLAEVAVKVGLGLAPGQELVMTAPVEALPLVRRITEHAYQAGASLVTTLYSDEDATLPRFRHAPDESFDKATGWLFDGMAEAFQNGAARLAIAGEDPSLLAGQDPDKVARANRARSAAYQPALKLIAGFAINWTIVCYATPAWARAVFPDEPRGRRPSPSSGTRSSPPRASTPTTRSRPGRRTMTASTPARPGSQRRALRRPPLQRAGHRPHRRPRRRARMARRLVAGPRTASSATPTSRPRRSSPRRTTDRVEGMVTSTKPLSYQGTLIEDIGVRFEDGPHRRGQGAPSGEDVLDKVLDTDEGARRLGEVALVPHSSPISQQRAAVLQHALRRERREPHRARPVLQPVLRRWRQPDAGGARGARRQLRA